MTEKFMTDNSGHIHLWLRDETKPHERLLTAAQ